MTRNEAADIRRQIAAEVTYAEVVAVADPGPNLDDPDLWPTEIEARR